MTERSKKIAAALAAVGAYLDEEAALAAAANNSDPKTTPNAPWSPSPWALSGRLNHMAGRMASLGSYPRRR